MSQINLERPLLWLDDLAPGQVFESDSRMTGRNRFVRRNGCGLEIGRFLEDGDRIDLEIEKIGVLTNTVHRQGDNGERMPRL